MKNVFSLLSACIALAFISSACSAQQRERLIARCTYTPASGVFTPSDSATFRYSGFRSTDSTWSNDPAYDHCNIWLQVSGAYQSGGKTVRIWDLNNKLQSDTFWNVINSVAIGMKMHKYTYDSHGFPAESIYMGWDSATQTWNQYSKNQLVYDASGNLQSQSWLTYFPSTASWDLNQTNTYRYHNGHLSTLTYYFHGNTTRNTLSYDSIGRLATTIQDDSMNSAGWNHNSRLVYSYDSVNNLSTMTILSASGFPWARSVYN